MYICRTVEDRNKERKRNHPSTRRTLLQTALPTAYLSGSAYAMFIYLHDIKNDYRVDKLRLS